MEPYKYKWQVKPNTEFEAYDNESFRILVEGF